MRCRAVAEEEVTQTRAAGAGAGVDEGRWVAWATEAGRRMSGEGGEGRRAVGAGAGTEEGSEAVVDRSCGLRG